MATPFEELQAQILAAGSEAGQGDVQRRNPRPSPLDLQQGGIFANSAQGQAFTSFQNDPRGFFERRIPGLFKGKKKERVQAQRVRDARALGDVARNAGIDTNAELGAGIANQLQSTLGIPGAGGLLRQEFQDLPEQKRSRELAAFDASLERFGNLQDFETQAILNQQAQNQLDSGFANPEQALDIGLKTLSLKQGLDSITKTRLIREQLGRISPVEARANPQLAAQIQTFEELDIIAIVRDILGDERLSEADREFYSEIGQVGFGNWIMSGSDIDIERLRLLEGRLQGTLDQIGVAFPKMLTNQPNLFEPLDFSDIGETVEPASSFDFFNDVLRNIRP